VTAAVELMRQFKVVKDSKDSLVDAHSSAVIVANQSVDQAKQIASAKWR
jgi:hypothetical protein